MGFLMSVSDSLTVSVFSGIFGLRWVRVKYLLSNYGPLPFPHWVLMCCQLDSLSIMMTRPFVKIYMGSEG